MNNKDNISSLYKMLISEGISEQELGGNEAGFRKALADPQRRKSGYDWLSQRVPATKLGSYDYFNEGVNIALSESNPVSRVGAGGQTSPSQSQPPLVLRPKAQSSATTKPNIATHTQGLAFGKEVPLGTEAVTPKFDRQADGTGKDKYIPQPTLVPSPEHPAMPKKVVKDYVHNKTYDWDSEQGQALVEKSSEVKNKYGDQLEKVGIGQFNIGERLENARKALAERGKQVLEKSEREYKWWHFGTTGGIAGMPRYVRTNNGLYTDPEYISLQGAIRALENSQELLNEQYKSQREKGITGFAKGAGRGIKNKLFDVRTWDGGVQDMIEGGALNVAINKYERGEKLSEAEQALLDAKATEVAVKAYTANDIGYGYEAGEVTAQALPFMLEMLINPASKAGTSIGSRVTRYALKRFAQKGLSEGAKKLATKAVGVASRVAGDAVGATGMAMTTGLGRVGADATRRMAGDIQHGHNEEGNTVFTGVENREEATDAVLKALGSTAIENHSEMVGEYFAPIGKALGRVFSKGASKVGLGSVSDAINAVANSPWAKKMKRFTDKTQWNGIVGEFSEEIAGGIENALIVGDQTLDTDPETGVFNSENLLRTAVGVGLMGGFMSAVRTAGYRTEAYEARKYMERSGRDAERLFEDKKQWEEIRQQIDKDDYENVGHILQDPNLSHEKRMAIIRYTVSRTLYQGVQEANNKVAQQGNVTASELSPILHQGENKVILAKRAGVEGNQAIINGNVVRREDGTIDRDASSKSIVVYNPESGEREMIDIDTLEGVEEEMSLEEWEARQSNPMPSEGYTPTDSVIPTPNAELEQSVQSEETTPAPEQEVGKQGVNYMFEPGDMFELELPGVGRIAGSAFGFDADGRLQIHTQEAVQLPGEKRPLMYHAVDAEQLLPLITSYTASERIDDEEAYSPYTEDTAASTEDWQEDEMYEPAYEENAWEDTSEEAPQEEHSEGYTSANEGRVAWHTPKDVTTSSAETQGLDYEQPIEAEVTTKGSELTPQANALPNEKGVENNVVSKWQAVLAEAEGDREMAEDVANSMLEDLKVDLKNHIAKGKKAKGKTTSEKFAYLKEHKAKRAELEAEIAEWENAIKEAKQSQLQSFAEEVEARGEQPSTLEEAKKQEEELRQARIQAEEDARLQREQYGEIPEWGEDKPSDARARGYRKYQNEIYERSSEIPAIKGADTRVKFHDEHQPEGRYTLVEASDIQPSHYEGKANPRFFLDEAQPKDRVDADSVHKARVMAEQMNPEEITSGATAYVGTPVVNARGEVLQGNGRTAGLRYMYEQSGASANGYRKYLSDNASRWGFSSEQVEGMRQPVLVRMTDVSDSRAIELGQYRSEDTESGGEQRIRPIETMRKLGDRMQEFTSRLLGTSDSDATLNDLIREHGADTLSWLLRMNIITAPQLQASVSKDGKVNKVGVEALTGILEESLFTNAPEQLRKDFEALPSNAQQALLATAYRDLDSSLDTRMMSELQASIQAYAIMQANGTFDNVRSTEEAIASVRQWLLQSEDFMDGVGALTPEERYGFSNFALHLASLYHKGKKTELTQLFNNLYDEVQGKAEDIFDPDRGVVKSLSEAINRILNIDYNGKIGSEAVAKPHQPSPSRERTINSDDTSGGSTERESRGDTSGGSDKTGTRSLETDIKPIDVGSFGNIRSKQKEASAPTSTQGELLDDTATQQKVDASEDKDSEKKRELHLSSPNATTKTKETTDASRLATDAVLLALENSGIDVVRATDVEVEAVLGGRSASVELSREQKRALDTAEQSRETTIATAVSSADGAKVLRNGNVEFMRTPRGVVYGWTEGGKIYLTEAGMQAETPIHEYTHIWAHAMQRSNPEGWQSIKDLLRGTPLWQEVLSDPNYQHIVNNEDAITSESLSRFSGQKGRTKMEEIAQQTLDNAKGAVDKIEAGSVLAKMREALNKFWRWVGKSLFDIKRFDSIEEVADRVLYDLVNGTELGAKGHHSRTEMQVKRAGYTEEMERIKSEAEANGTFMLAPNGKATNLNERQWLQVRTKAFKGWFGDWEKSSRIEKLRRAEPVVLTGNEYEGKYKLERKSAKEWVKSNLRGKYTIEDTQEVVTIGRKGVNKVTSHSAGSEAHLKSFVAIPEMLNKATFITEEQASKNNAQYPRYRYYVVGLRIDGIDYTAKLTIGVDENGNKYYDHALTEIEKVNLLDRINSQADRGFISTGAEPNLSVTESKDSKLLLILQTDASKVVDENGEPLVVYHGTNAKFNTFSLKKTNTPMFYFTSNREKIEQGSVGARGSGRIIEAYLNLQKPAGWNEDDRFTTDQLKYRGYDGKMLLDDGYNVYVAFSPEQIKSATDNVGTFDEGNADIRYRRGNKEVERSHIDEEYLSAIERGDMEEAERLVHAYAKSMGYSPSEDYQDAHVAPVAQIDAEDFTNLEALEGLNDDGYDINLYGIAHGIQNVPDDYFSPLGAKRYMYDTIEGRESYANLMPVIRSIQSQMREYGEVINIPKIVVYRAVPNEVKEGTLQSGGQWVSPSKSYAEAHGNARFGDGAFRIIEEEVSAENLWWDNNDINEWGFDDGKTYGYKNTKNSRKLYDVVTYDDQGRVIPLSHRFDEGKSDARYRRGQTSDRSGKDSPRAIAERAEGLGRELGIAVRIVSDKRTLPKRQQGVMGWFDPRSGEVVVVLENHRSVSDVEATVYHEVIGHKGLRELVGEEVFETFLHDLYKSLPQDVQSRISMRFAGGGVRSLSESIEEYLAEFAERGFDKERSLWRKIVDKVRELVRNYINPNLLVTENDIRYLLWKAYHQRKRSANSQYSHIAEALALGEDIAKRNDLGITLQDRTLENINEQFNEILLGLTEENKDKVVLSLGMPSLILQSAGVSPKPMKLYGNKVIKKMKKHGFALSDLVDLPRAVANPVAVFNNIGREGNRSILTELRTTQGNILVTIDLGKDADIDFNVISSVFGKGYPNLIDWINKGYISYVNKEKARKFLLHDSAPIADASANNGLVSATKVIENFENPSIEQGNRYRKNEQSIKQAKAVDYLYLLESEGKYIETGQSRVDEDYDEGEAEREQRLVLRPKYEVREYTDEGYDATIEEYEHIEDAEKALRDRHRPETDREYSEPYRELTIAFEPLWLNLNNEEVESDDTLLYDEMEYAGYELPEALLDLDYGVLGEYHFDSVSEEKDQKESAIIEGLNDMLVEALSHVEEDLDGRPIRIDASRAFTQKYSSIEFYDKETDELVGRIQLRLSDHSYNPANNDESARDGNFISVVLTDNDPTYNKFSGRYNLYYNYENSTSDIVADVVDRVYSIINEWEFDDGRIRYRRGDAPNVEARVGVSGSARAEYEYKVRHFGDENRKGEENYFGNFEERIIEGYVDYMRAPKIFMGAILKEDGGELQEFEDFYTAENHLSSRNQGEASAYKRDHIDPLLEHIATIVSGGVSYEDIKSYLIAKHGLERNEYMSRKTAELEATQSGKTFDGEYTLEDYSGLVALTQSEEHFTELAEELVREFEAKIGNDVVDELWGRIRSATRASLRKGVLSHIITKAQSEEWQSMYQYYVPLRGWAEERTAEEMWNYKKIGNSNSGNVLNKKTDGRKSLADDPIAQIAFMGEGVIRQGNRNLVKNMFLNFVLNHPTDLATVSRTWYVKQDDGSWLKEAPNFDDAQSEAERAEIANTFEERMKQLQKEKKARKRPPKGGEPIKVDARISPSELKQHAIHVLRGGEEYIIYINANPRVAQAINGLLDEVDNDNFFSIANNYLAQTLTSKNPTFILKNGVMDTIGATVALSIKEDATYVKNFASLVKNPIQTARLINKFNAGTLDMDNELERYFDEFIRYGGETGHTQIHSVRDYKNDIERFLKRQTPAENIRQALGRPTATALRWVGDGIEFANRTAEVNTRFATYVASRKAGRSVQRSVHDAKEVTVNFNRKGTGGMGARLLRYAYVFLNASIQSMRQLKELRDANPKRFYAFVTGITTLGVALPLTNLFFMALLSDDDDIEEKYWAMNEYTRRSNLLFYVGNGNFVKIPLPPQFRPLYGAGENIFSFAMGRQNYGDTMINIAGGFGDLSPVDPIGGNGGNVLINLLPSHSQTIAQLTHNVNYFGQPIWRETDYNSEMPEWTKAKDANPYLVDFTKFLNALSGGDDYTSGKIDFNPEVIEHLIEGYTGGTGRFVNQVVRTTMMPFDEDQRDLRNIPFAGTFLGTSPYGEAGRLSSQYWELRAQFEEIERIEREYKKAIKNGDKEERATFKEHLRTLRNSPEYQVYRQKTRNVDTIYQLYKKRKKTEDPQKQDSIAKKMQDLERKTVEGGMRLREYMD